MVLKLEITNDNLEVPTCKVNVRRDSRKSRFCYRRLSRRSGVLHLWTLKTPVKQV
jgi:hypothetical protein